MTGSFIGLDGTVSENIDTPYVTAQAFMGFDYDVTENLYIGTHAKFSYVNGDIIDEDIEVGQFVFMGALGYKF